MLKNVFTPLANLRRWFSDDTNPCAPHFHPALWNDAGSLAKGYKGRYAVEIEHLREIDKHDKLRHLPWCRKNGDIPKCGDPACSSRIKTNGKARPIIARFMAIFKFQLIQSTIIPHYLDRNQRNLLNNRLFLQT